MSTTTNEVATWTQEEKGIFTNLTSSFTLTKSNRQKHATPPSFNKLSVMDIPCNDNLTKNSSRKINLEQTLLPPLPNHSSSLSDPSPISNAFKRTKCPSCGNDAHSNNTQSIPHYFNLCCNDAELIISPFLKAPYHHHIAPNKNSNSLFLDSLVNFSPRSATPRTCESSPTRRYNFNAANLSPPKETESEYDEEVMSTASDHTVASQKPYSNHAVAIAAAAQKEEAPKPQRVSRSATAALIEAAGATLNPIVRNNHNTTATGTDIATSVVENYAIATKRSRRVSVVSQHVAPPPQQPVKSTIQSNNNQNSTGAPSIASTMVPGGNSTVASPSTADWSSETMHHHAAMYNLELMHNSNNMQNNMNSWPVVTMGPPHPPPRVIPYEPNVRLPLGEQGRCELKWLIGDSIKSNPELRSKVMAIAKLKCATISQLLHMAHVCGLWEIAVSISDKFVESRQRNYELQQQMGRTSKTANKGRQRQ